MTRIKSTSPNQSITLTSRLNFSNRNLSPYICNHIRNRIKGVSRWNGSMSRSWQEKKELELVSVTKPKQTLSMLFVLKLNNFSYLWDNEAITRCFANTAVVTAPTPPGTGVAMEAIPSRELKSTSPQSFPFSSTLIPTSITTVPVPT